MYHKPLDNPPRIVYNNTVRVDKKQSAYEFLKRNTVPIYKVSHRIGTGVKMVYSIRVKEITPNA